MRPNSTADKVENTASTMALALGLPAPSLSALEGGGAAMANSVDRTVKVGIVVELASCAFDGAAAARVAAASTPPEVAAAAAALAPWRCCCNANAADRTYSSSSSSTSAS